MSVIVKGAAKRARLGMFLYEEVEWMENYTRKARHIPDIYQIVVIKMYKTC